MKKKRRKCFIAVISCACVMCVGVTCVSVCDVYVRVCTLLCNMSPRFTQQTRMCACVRLCLCVCMCVVCVRVCGWDCARSNVEKKR